MLQETGAFVYGAMSFLDKMSNGIVIQMIQVFYPSHNRYVAWKCKRKRCSLSLIRKPRVQRWGPLE